MQDDIEAESLGPLEKIKPPRRGFEPFQKYFVPESNDYPFKPNMKLIFSLMPYLSKSIHSPPKLVLCPMAGVGAVPIMVLAYYTQTNTEVIAWEENEKWRKILEKNFQCNYFCKDRWKLVPIESIPDKIGDAGMISPSPLADAEEFTKQLSDTLNLLHKKLKKYSRLVIVSRRLEIDFDYVFYTELAIEQSIDPKLYEIIQIATVTARTPQRRLYNKEAQKDVFVIIQNR